MKAKFSCKWIKHMYTATATERFIKTASRNWLPLVGQQRAASHIPVMIVYLSGLVLQQAHISSCRDRTLIQMMELRYNMDLTDTIPAEEIEYFR